MHCEWAVLSRWIHFGGPVTGPSTRSPEVQAVAAAARAACAAPNSIAAIRPALNHDFRTKDLQVLIDLMLQLVD
jgi:hypothetical protein